MVAKCFDNARYRQEVLAAREALREEIRQSPVPLPALTGPRGELLALRLTHPGLDKDLARPEAVEADPV